MTVGLRRPLAVVALLAVALTVAGCGSPGGLQDDGPARTVTPPPVAQALWVDAQASPAPSFSPEAPKPLPAPVPVPGITVPSGDITTVDVKALLTKDPAPDAEERAAVNGCTGCEVRAPQFRDVTGDGRPELITAVVTASGRSVLHVYTLKGEQVVPVLATAVLRGFSADTVGRDLRLYEPTTASSRTTSRYRWDGSRLVLVDQQIQATGPVPDAPSCPSPVAKPPGRGTTAPEPADSAAPAAEPTRVPRQGVTGPAVSAVPTTRPSNAPAPVQTAGQR